MLQFVGPRCGRGVDHLIDPLLELLEAQGAVVQCRWESEAVLHQRLLARAVAVVHPRKLGDGHMRFINEEQEVIGEVIY